MNTHSPAPFAGEGVYEWLKNREPRWAKLAIIHRLDKETSGVIVFGKTSLADQSLSAQFEGRETQKIYLLFTDRSVSFDQITAESSLVRAGEKYLSRPAHAGAALAETHFRKLNSVETASLIGAGELKSPGTLAGSPSSHGSNTSNPRSRGGKELSHSGRSTLRRKRRIKLSARIVFCSNILKRVKD